MRNAPDVASVVATIACRAARYAAVVSPLMRRRAHRRTPADLFGDRLHGAV